MGNPSLYPELLKEVQQLIDRGKQEIAIQVNSTMTLVYWKVGNRINEELLKGKRATYGAELVKTLAEQLVQNYGRSFEYRNLRRMINFAQEFPELSIVTTLSSQLSWSHFIELFSLKNKEARKFYITRIIEGKWSVRHTRKQIAQKLYERSQIANAQLPIEGNDVQHSFKDPYFLDFLGLKEGYLEGDLEAAILKELESFILELGTGFTFVERQKRMIIDGEDFYLDLLFFHRKLKRLVAIELKIGKFTASHKGQMELYLKWLNTYDKQVGEEYPIGLILCAETRSEQIELLEMHKDGIMVAEYWTELPPKKVLEEKIHLALKEARERMAKKRLE